MTELAGSSEFGGGVPAGLVNVLGAYSDQVVVVNGMMTDLVQEN